MTGTHHIAPSTHLRTIRSDDDGRGRPARTPSRVVTLLRRVGARGTVDGGLPRWVDASPAGAA